MVCWPDVGGGKGRNATLKDQSLKGFKTKKKKKIVAGRRVQPRGSERKNCLARSGKKGNQNRIL